METWIRREIQYKGRIVDIEAGDVRLDDGVEAFREVVRHPGGVAVVPVLNERVILVRQYRIAIGRDILELPAGKLEGEEGTEHRGRSELEEETGYRAGRMIPAGSVFASVGYSSEEIHLYLAFDLEKTVQRLESDERIELVEIPIADIPGQLERNAIQDAKTVVGLNALLDYLGRDDS